MHFVGGFVASPQLAADRLQSRPCAHWPVQNHQAQFALIEVEMAAAPLDDLVVAFVSGDFQSVLLRERFGFGQYGFLSVFLPQIMDRRECFSRPSRRMPFPGAPIALESIAEAGLVVGEISEAAMRPVYGRLLHNFYLSCWRLMRLQALCRSLVALICCGAYKLV
jgi:hypothetical protein